MSRNIVITTESGSDVPGDIAEKYHIHVIPMHVVFGGETCEDGSIPVDKVFEYYKSTGKVPSTSTPNVAQDVEVFRKIREEDPDSVIFHISYSSKCSGAHQVARLAIEECQLPDIYLIDSLSVSGGCTAHIVEAAKLIARKKDEVTDYRALADEVQQLAYRVSCEFMPNTLEYLKAGGRCSNAAYLGATILKLKPLIEIRDGFLVATKKYRGTMERIVDRFMADYMEKYHPEKECLYLMYGKGLSDAVLKRMKENALSYGFKRVAYVMTGCVISCHGGPGAIGLAAIKSAE